MILDILHSLLREFVQRELRHLRNSTDFGYATVGYLREAPARAQQVYERVDSVLTA